MFSRALKKSPKFFGFTLFLFLFLGFFLLIYRYIGWNFFFAPQVIEVNETKIRYAFYLGAKFDVRLILILILPSTIFSFVWEKKFFSSRAWRRFFRMYLIIIFFLLNLIYAIDLGYFSYVGDRLNHQIFDFLKNPIISAKMLWESYATFKLLLLIIGITWLQFWAVSRVYHWFCYRSYVSPRKTKIVFGVVIGVLMFTGIYGKLSVYPLRWSDAFFSKDKSLGQFALNPVLYFFETLQFSNLKPDVKQTENFFPAISKYLNIGEHAPLNFSRNYSPTYDSIPKAKNVVIIMMESIGAQPLGVFNNPLKCTPFIDSLCQNSWFFDHFYVHRFGTARTVYSSITGIPDVVVSSTASRVPQANDQSVIFEQLQDVEKFYFLGGSANWANIRAIFTNNIHGIKMYEENKFFDEDRADVWGIDDALLFKRAVEVLSKTRSQKKNFVAYIQTASYHKPYTVPDDLKGFKKLTPNDLTDLQVKSAGFVSLEQVNSLRFFDYNLRNFFKVAKKSGIYDDTVFILFGDHNGHVSPYKHMEQPEFETELGQNHVPLIIHAPFIKPKRDSRIAHVIDIFPTIADLMEQPYTNYTLGRSILRRPANDMGAAFVFNRVKGKDLPGMITHDYYFYTQTKGKGKWLYLYDKKNFHRPTRKNKAMEEHLDSLAKAFYHSSMYLYFNNQKKKYARKQG